MRRRFLWQLPLCFHDLGSQTVLAGFHIAVLLAVGTPAVRSLVEGSLVGGSPAVGIVVADRSIHYYSLEVRHNLVADSPVRIPVVGTVLRLEDSHHLDMAMLDCREKHELVLERRCRACYIEEEHRWAHRTFATLRWKVIDLCSGKFLLDSGGL